MKNLFCSSENRLLSVIAAATFTVQFINCVWGLV